MAFMRGSPVLTDQKFQEQTDEARAGAAGGAAAFGSGLDTNVGGRPMASAPDSYSVMTVGGSITATCVLMVLLLGAAAFGWSQVDQVEPIYNSVTGENMNSPVIPPWIFIALLVGIGVGLVTAFMPKAARITAPIYALAYGVAIGAISAVYNSWYDGIVTQAVFATLAIFATMLFLYVTRIIKVTNRFVMIVAAATMGIFLMYMIAFVVQLFGGTVAFLTEPSPLGIALSVGIIIIAALNLAIDFAFIEKASNAGVPKYMEWYAAFGIVTTLVWIYLEVLRLLAMLNRN
jgi:uncharacterized YccA/Bax inhibitor family protein